VTSLMLFRRASTSCHAAYATSDCLFAVAYWAGDCGVLVVAFRSAHGSAPIVVIVLAYMLGQLGNTLPLPGGVGGVEPAMLGVLASSGVNLGLGAAAIVLYRFVSLGVQSVLGTVAIATLIPSLQRRSEPSSDSSGSNIKPALDPQ